MTSVSNAIRPTADTATVEFLVGQAKRGLVRIPAFQRPLKWGPEQVVELFDSIYKGYPIGSLLLQKSDALADKVKIGPLYIDAPSTHEALWVVDGQQRLTALTVGLARPTPVPILPSADDPFVVYFDVQERVFKESPKNGVILDTWVPVAQLLDASGLSEWIYNWKHGTDAILRSAVFDAGTRLRQYSVPLYTIDTKDENVLKDIFYRTNKAGKPLEWKDVHDALFGKPGESPSTLRELADELSQLGMGRPDEKQLLSCLMAYQGLDPTRNITEHYRRSPDVLRDAVQHALPTLRNVLSFLRRKAEIPHLRLLPRAEPLVVLTRFFRFFPTPDARTTQLLVRWTWRTFLGKALFNEQTLLRHGTTAINGKNAEEDVQALLALVPKALPSELQFRLPSRFDARAAASRLAALGMTSLTPLDFETQQPVDVAKLLEEQDVRAFRIIVPSGGSTLLHSPANRMLLPGSGSMRQELKQYSYEEHAVVFTSHGITADATQALKSGDVQQFFEQRRKTLEQAAQQLGNRLAGWGQSDRPSVKHLLTLTTNV